MNEEKQRGFNRFAFFESSGAHREPSSGLNIWREKTLNICDRRGLNLFFGGGSPTEGWGLPKKKFPAGYNQVLGKR